MTGGKKGPAQTAPAARAGSSEPEPRVRGHTPGRLAIDVAIMLGAFALATLVAEAAGAANLGTALSFGQIAFTLAAVYVLLRR